MPAQTSTQTLSATIHRSPTLSRASPPSSIMKPTLPAPTKESNEKLPEDLNLNDLFEAKSVTDTAAVTEQEQ